MTDTRNYLGIGSTTPPEYSDPYSAPASPLEPPPSLSFQPQAQMSLPFSPATEDKSEPPDLFRDVLGGIGGFLGNRNVSYGLANTAARKNYDETFSSTLKQTSAAAPVLLHAMENGTSAALETYKRLGLNTQDIFGPSVFKAYEYSMKVSQSSANGLRFSPDEILSRVKSGMGPGDYVARVLPKSVLANPDVSLARGETAWVAPLNELLGYQANQKAITKSLGFPEHMVNNTANEQVLLIYESKTIPHSSATWDNLNKMSKDSGRFDKYLSKNPNLFEELKTFDYKSHREKASQFKSELEYMRTLPTAERNIYSARLRQDLRHGASVLFDGRGVTVDPSGTIGQREFITANKSLQEIKPAAVINLKGGEIQVLQAEKIPDVPNKMINGAQLKKTGLYSALTDMGFELVNRGASLVRGEITFSQATENLPAELAKAASGGAVIGLTAETLEKVLTRSKQADWVAARLASRRLFETTASIGEKVAQKTTGQSLRQVGGGMGSAAIVSSLLSGYQQYSRYNSGEISGQRAAANTITDTAIGAGSATLGIMGGGAIATLAGGGAALGPVGFVAGVAIGYGIDQLAEHTYFDEWINEGVYDAIGVLGEAGTAARNGISYASGKTYDIGVWAVSSAASGAKYVASGAYNGVTAGAKTIYGAATSTASAAYEWLTDW